MLRGPMWWSVVVADQTLPRLSWVSNQSPDQATDLYWIVCPDTRQVDDQVGDQVIVGQQVDGLVCSLGVDYSICLPDSNSCLSLCR